MMLKGLVLAVCVLALAGWASGAVVKVWPLGMTGGVDESSITSFMVAHSDKPTDYLVLDMGSFSRGVLAYSTLGDPAALAKNVKGFFLTHSHLDHGLSMYFLARHFTNSAKMPVYGFGDVLNDATTILDGKIAPPADRIDKRVMAEATAMQVTNEIKVTAFEVKHAFLKSTAFLVDFAGTHQILFFGDVGPDTVQQSNLNQKVWKAAAPLVLAKTLKAIFLESAYFSDRPDQSLFGHLTPKHIEAEMKVLLSEVKAAAKAKSQTEPTDLAGITFVCIHLKTNSEMAFPQANVVADMRQDLQQKLGPLKMAVVVPAVGTTFDLS